MRLTIETAADIRDRNIARAWVGRAESGAWQCAFVEWAAPMARLVPPYAGFCAPQSALTPVQAGAVADVLRFKLETGVDIAGLTLEV